MEPNVVLPTSSFRRKGITYLYHVGIRGMNKMAEIKPCALTQGSSSSQQHRERYFHSALIFKSNEVSIRNCLWV